MDVTCRNGCREERMGEMAKNSANKNWGKKRERENGSEKGEQKTNIANGKEGKDKFKKNNNSMEMKRLNDEIRSLRDTIQGLSKQLSEDKSDARKTETIEEMLVRIEGGLSGKMNEAAGRIGKLEEANHNIILAIKGLEEVKELKGEWEQTKSRIGDLDRAVVQLTQTEEARGKLTEKLNDKTQKILDIGQELSDAKQELAGTGNKILSQVAELSGVKADFDRAKEEWDSKAQGLSVENKSLSEIIEKLTKSKKDLIKEKEDLIKEKENLIKEKEDLSREKENLSREKEDLTKEKEDLIKEKEDLIKEKENLSKSNKELAEKKEELYKAGQKAEEDLRKASEKAGMQEEELSALNRQIEQRNTERTVRQKKIAVLESDLEEKEIKLGEAKTALSNAERQLEEYSSRFGSWEELTGAYRDLMEKMYRCVSLQEIIGKYALEEDLQSADTVENMLKFIGVVGVGGSFAQVVYNVMRNYKKTNAQYLTEEERSFIAELNGYCRRTLPAEFDVLDIPDTGKFDSAVMQDMEKPTAPYRNIAGVYVPGLRGDAKSFKQRAIVHGTKG